MAKKQKATKKPQNRALSLTVIILGTFLLLVGLAVFFQHPLEQKCANADSCISDLSGKRELDSTGVFMGKNVEAPITVAKDIYALDETQAVLGEATNKKLYVDLSKQKLLAYEGDTLIYEFPVSTGKWYATPTGEFRIWTWLRYTRMAGGNKANGTYYNLPNVPYTMYFANSSVPKTQGFGIHGAYWHNNFGHPMSHGCVNMREADVAQIYQWTYKNTEIPLVIYGTTPKA
jgi:lipoprotein-anchoring transpeptidase ErfK/SrfK